MPFWGDSSLSSFSWVQFPHPRLNICVHLFTGLPCGSANQVSSLQRAVQFIPNQAFLHLKHSHYLASEFNRHYAQYIFSLSGQTNYQILIEFLPIKQVTYFCITTSSIKVPSIAKYGYIKRHNSLKNSCCRLFCSGKETSPHRILIS